MRAFVTGGTGFVGSHLVDALLDRRANVACLARDPSKIEALFPNRPVTIIPGDLSNMSALEEGCATADVVFHLAGLTTAGNGEEMTQVNAQATRVLT